uniref:Charged multivesicular body protein 3 n=1 Tax=Eptatretus burgeri TaxID=7764 RepID=A0A8C4NH29_EPTBU
MGLFGKHHQQPPKELVAEWSQKLRREMRGLDRQIRVLGDVQQLHIHGGREAETQRDNFSPLTRLIQGIEREEARAIASLRAAAKSGNRGAAAILAREVHGARRAVSRLHVTKAHINSATMGMKNQLALAKVTGEIGKSTEVMAAVQQLYKVSELQGVMGEMAREMCKAGIIEEIMDDTLSGLVGDEDEIDEDVDEEVDKILFDLTAGALGKAPATVTEPLPAAAAAAAGRKGNKNVVQQETEEEEEEEEEVEIMKHRLAALRS